MISYPISFYGEGKADSGIKSHWSNLASDYKSDCCVPQEFEGAGGTFSPEDYFLMALQNCFIATFKVYSEYSKVTFGEIFVKSELIVDKNENQKPIMKALKMKIQITAPSDERKVKFIVAKTLENGFILNSVKTEIIPEISFVS
jgi:uncharacterized OsmC-like protein